eukprot:scaffold7006_cov174-Skeletonema_marinoi.AAC.60
MRRFSAVGLNFVEHNIPLAEALHPVSLHGIFFPSRHSPPPPTYLFKASLYKYNFLATSSSDTGPNGYLLLVLSTVQRKVGAGVVVFGYYLLTWVSSK